MRILLNYNSFKGISLCIDSKIQVDSFIYADVGTTNLMRY